LPGDRAEQEIGEAWCGRNVAGETGFQQTSSQTWFQYLHISFLCLLLDKFINFFVGKPVLKHPKETLLENSHCSTSPKGISNKKRKK